MPARISVWEGRLSTATVITKQIKRALLGSYADQASNEALGAEVVRVALWTQSVYKHASPLSAAAVTTRRLLDQARAFWAPIYDAHRESISPEIMQQHAGSKGEMTVEPSIGRELLDALDEQGDILSLKGGLWLPSPLRLVPLTTTDYLLVGGMPTHLLPDTLLKALTLHGSFRHIESHRFSALPADAKHTVPWKFQSLESWLGLSPPSLDDLVHAFNARELHPVEHQSDASLEAYFAHVDEPQYLRWRSLNYVDDGRYLLRTSTPWGTGQYSIGHVRNHRLTEQGAELHDMDIRRLCYALDRQAGKPTRATWKTKQGELILKSELPGRERKYLSSIGFLQTNEDSYYPRRWVRINPQFASNVEALLHQLGIQIDHI